MKKITKRPNGTTRVQTINTDKTKTQEQWAKSCDINNIMARYLKTGSLEHVRQRNDGVYMDLANIKDFHESMNQVLHAKETFDSLPAKTREYFKNSPNELIMFLQDKKNQEKAYELGLANRPQPPPVPPTEPDPKK